MGSSRTGGNCGSSFHNTCSFCSLSCQKYIIGMVYGLRELKNKSQDNSEWVKNGDFITFDAYDALRCATMRYDSASPKTGAWPSLFYMSPVCHFVACFLHVGRFDSCGDHQN